MRAKELNQSDVFFVKLIVDYGKDHGIPRAVCYNVREMGLKTFDEMSYTKMLRERITALLNERKNMFNTFTLDSDAYDELIAFTTAGKLFRGSLLLAAYESLTDHPATDTVLDCAAALELLEAGVLMQDDVMDESSVRRGRPATRGLFATKAGTENDNENRRFGDSAAVVLGDIAYFLSYEILASLSVSVDTYKELIKLNSAEMTRVSLGQLEDLRMSISTAPVQEADILAMYKGKTSRYTCVLPLLSASILAGTTSRDGADLEKIGLLAGVVYQLSDDMIDLFGTTSKTGKPVGGDIREGKKTLLWHYAIAHMDRESLGTFQRMFGRSEISQEDIHSVIKIIEASGAKSYTAKMIKQYRMDTESVIQSSDMPAKTKELLNELLGYIAVRSR